MNSKTILLNTILLLYWSNRSNLDDKKIYTETVTDILSKVTIPTSNVGSEDARELILELISITKWLLHTVDEGIYDYDTLVQRMKVASGNDLGFYNAVVDAFKIIDDPIYITQRCEDYSRSLRNHLKEEAFRDLVKQWVSDVVYNNSPLTGDLSSRAEAMVAELEKYTLNEYARDIKQIAGVLEVADFDKFDDVKSVFDSAKTESSSEGVLQTGWQAINRMLGHFGGFVRGNFCVVGALQHNYKSGFTLNLIKHFALYNKPYMLDESKKPLLLHFSAENTMTMDITNLYTSLKENETGIPVEGLGDLNTEEATQYITDKLSVNGYHFKMIKVVPSDFTYKSLFRIVNQLENDGYEIHAINFDYLNMINKEGCTFGAMGDEVRDLFRRVRNFMAARKITFITPHQISMEAMQHVRNGTVSFVQDIANKAYWDSCKRIAQEVDIEILLHIEEVNGDKYLSINRGKHRGLTKPTFAQFLYTVLPFMRAGAICDDIYSQDTSMRKPGGKPQSQGGGNAWFQTQSTSVELKKVEINEDEDALVL